jgi:dipeptidyl-peptidase-4
MGALLRSTCAATLGAVAVPAAAQPRLSLEWILSEEVRAESAVPDHAWLQTGAALLYDPRRPKAERTLELLEPAGGRRDLVDPGVALAGLNGAFSLESPLAELGWPSDVDPRGRWVAYEKDDDVALLSLETSEVVAVASSSAVEKSPRFSPDGRHLAYVRDSDLYVWSLDTRTEARLTRDGSPSLLNGTLSWVYWEEIFGRADRGYVWSPDSKRIAFLQTDESEVGVMTHVDFEPYLPRVIHQRYPKAGAANPKVRAGVVALEGGGITWMELAEHPYEYLVRLDWLPDGRRVALQTQDRSQTTLDLLVGDVATGKVRRVLRESDPGWVNRHDDLRFLGGGERFLWASERDGFSHLYLYETSGELVRQVTRGEWSLRASGGVSWTRQSVVHVDEPGGFVYFTAQADSPLERQLYRIRLDGSGMTRLTREPGTHRVAFRPDGLFYLDEWSQLDRPPALALRRTRTETELEVTPASQRLLAAGLPPRELLQIEASDGFALPAMLIRPPDLDPAGRYPVVVYVYGGPSAPTVSSSWGASSRHYFHQLLADRGFVVLYVDNRSAAAISKKLENRILGDGYGETELGDLLDAVAWLEGLPYVDPERIGIWGWSGGGAHTLQAMTRSRKFAAGIAVAAVSDWRYYDSIWAEAFMKTPEENPDGYEITSNVARAGDLHGRLLLVHGTYDDNVHVQNSWSFADALIEAGLTFELMVYPMRQHGLADTAAQRHVYRTMLEFWERYLK